MAFELPSPTQVVAITLHRGWRQFSERDRLLLNLIRPQLVQGLRNARAYERLQRLLDSLEQRVESAGEGLLLLDEGDQVEYASPNARSILSRWLGGWRRPRLPDRLEDWVRDRGTAQGPSAPPWPMISDSGITSMRPGAARRCAPSARGVCSPASSRRTR